MKVSFGTLDPKHVIILVLTGHREGDSPPNLGISVIPRLAATVLFHMPSAAKMRGAVWTSGRGM